MARPMRPSLIMKRILWTIFTIIVISATTFLPKSSEPVANPPVPEELAMVEQLEVKDFKTLTAKPQIVEKPEPPKPAPFVVSGDKQTWLIASGIPENLWFYVDYIVSRESGWNPCAYYPGRSDCNAVPYSACGLVQQNPCHKIPGDWRDPVAALKWQYGYVNERYGGYPQAYDYWLVHHVY